MLQAAQNSSVYAKRIAYCDRYEDKRVQELSDESKIKNGDLFDIGDLEPDSMDIPGIIVRADCVIFKR
jgi:hypothetical protein